MEPAKQRMSGSAVKVFKVLDVLERNFVHGFAPTDIATETGFTLSAINGYVNTLIEAGRAERIQETGRVRVSHKAAQKAVQILHSLDEAERKLTESRTRITRS
jgi:DNA-binding IclR family transcriptional regulator